MYILAVGLNHKTAPVEVREKVAFTRNDLPEAFRQLRSYPEMDGCAILSTCNRTEIYAAVTDVEAGLGHIRSFIAHTFQLNLGDFLDYLYVHTLYDAVRHLFRVASGLDSMMLGETQILGQVREAYQLASELGGSNGILNTMFQQAITVGKRVRTETMIDQNAVSISYAAVELAKKALGELDGRSVLVVGAGKMSNLAVRYLVDHGVSTVLVSNRSYDRAAELAGAVGGLAVHFDQLLNRLPEADIVISCTAASHAVLHYQEVADALAGRTARPLLMIDIAVPRDIDPEIAKIPGVTLCDIDDLQGVVDHNLTERKRAAQEAEAIIDAEIEAFFRWLGSLSVVPTIMALREKGQQIKEAELERALNRLGDLSEREKKVVGSMANSIVNQLLHMPIIKLKEYSTTHQGHLYAELLQNLFELEVEGERPRRPAQQPRQEGFGHGGGK